MSAVAVAAPWQWHRTTGRKVSTGMTGAVPSFRAEIKAPSAHTLPRRQVGEGAYRADIGEFVGDTALLHSLGETLTAISDLQHLPEDWDGEGATPPTKDAVSRAGLWLIALAARLIDEATPEGTRWIAPLVSDSADGGVMLEWWSGPRKLTVYIWGDRVEYVQVWGPNMRDQMREGSATKAGTFMPVWSWLTK